MLEDIGKLVTGGGKIMPAEKLTLVPGYFNESLRPSLSRRHAFLPAIYIDNDVDIYLSTLQVPCSPRYCTSPIERTVG